MRRWASAVFSAAVLCGVCRGQSSSAISSTTTGAATGKIYTELEGLCLAAQMTPPATSNGLTIGEIHYADNANECQNLCNNDENCLAFDTKSPHRSNDTSNEGSAESYSISCIFYHSTPLGAFPGGNENITFTCYSVEISTTTTTTQPATTSTTAIGTRCPQQLSYTDYSEEAPNFSCEYNVPANQGDITRNFICSSAVAAGTALTAGENGFSAQGATEMTTEFDYFCCYTVYEAFVSASHCFRNTVEAINFYDVSYDFSLTDILDCESATGAVDVDTEERPDGHGDAATFYAADCSSYFPTSTSTTTTTTTSTTTTTTTSTSTTGATTSTTTTTTTQPATTSTTTSTSTTGATASTTTTTASTTSVAPADNSGLSAGAVAGIAVGAVVFIAVIGGAAAYFR